MAVYRYVNIQLPEAERLADLYGIEYDLTACRAYCEKYLQAYRGQFLTDPAERERLGTEHLGCFSAHVFVKYGRCFKGGIRAKTSEALTGSFTPEELELHQLILDIRDKYIAHSVNNLEVHIVRVSLNPEERGRAVNNVNIESRYLAGPEPQLFAGLQGLIDKHLKWIELEKEKEQKRLMQLVSQRFSFDHLYALEARALPDIDYSKVDQRRGRP